MPQHWRTSHVIHSPYWFGDIIWCNDIKSSHHGPIFHVGSLRKCWNFVRLTHELTYQNHLRLHQGQSLYTKNARLSGSRKLHCHIDNFMIVTHKVVKKRQAWQPKSCHSGNPSLVPCGCQNRHHHCDNLDDPIVVKVTTFSRLFDNLTFCAYQFLCQWANSFAVRALTNQQTQTQKHVGTDSITVTDYTRGNNSSISSST